jgi:hypothetical protein|tara:strand:+ start:100 stop:492 length:393 start_codon:yes stop_codon:yes gene_type:complete
MTLAEMKKKYSSMTPAERAANVQTFRDAAKNSPKSKPAAKAKPAKAKPRQTTKSEAASRFYSSSSGTRGQNMPSNPALKSQPKQPKRSDFPAGRSGASSYQAALRKYKNRTRTPNRTSLKPKVNRRGRRV